MDTATRRIKRRHKRIIIKAAVVLQLASFTTIYGLALRSERYSDEVTRLEKEIVANEQTIETLEKKLDKTSKLLDKTNELLDNSEKSNKELEQELNKFINPIEYGIAAAPLYPVALSEELQQFTYDTCVYYEIEEYYPLILAVMWRESNFTVDAISKTNDYGIMQINECNHAYLKEQLGFVDIMDPKNNIEAGIYILSNLLYDYGDPHKALMAYNMGPGGAAAHWKQGNYTSTYSQAIVQMAESIANNELK